MQELSFIEEELYQRIKKEMKKTDDYFTIEELKILKNSIKKLT